MRRTPWFASIHKEHTEGETARGTPSTTVNGAAPGKG
jgi:hypothetical protein